MPAPVFLITPLTLIEYFKDDVRTVFELTAECLCEALLKILVFLSAGPLGNIDVRHLRIVVPQFDKLPSIGQRSVTQRSVERMMLEPRFRPPILHSDDDDNVLVSPY